MATSNHLTALIAAASPCARMTLNYRHILNREYSNRCTKNPAYSMRGFARDIGVSQSFLSQVLSCKRKLSDEKAALLVQKLKLPDVTKKLFVNLVRYELTEQKELKEHLENEIKRLSNSTVHYKVMAEQVFNVVADWHYFAILELTELENFRNDSAWIAKKLNISHREVRLALTNLKDLGLLVEEQGKLIKVSKDYIFADVASSAIKKHHRDTLQLAQSALEKQPMPEREFFTVCFAMDPLQISTAKKKIREFCDSLMTELQETPRRSVYKLAVQFFRLDNGDIK